jgi:phospholipid/cholesterol/gamma-HCH transport system ATP-binding protein
MGKILRKCHAKSYSLRVRVWACFFKVAHCLPICRCMKMWLSDRAHTKLPEHLLSEIMALKLESVGLRGAEQMMPSELSGGMNRRVALARAIALDPELIMYDEPFAGQDPIVMGVLTRLIRSLREALDLTTIIVSHDVAETLSIADYIYVVAEGKVQGEGTPEQLKQANASPFVKQFLTGAVEGPVDYQFSHKAYLNTEVQA